MRNEFEISFDNLHKLHKKCTPKQIMYYQIALKLHKLINDPENVLSFEHITVMNQIVCTRRKINFQILRNCNSKIWHEHHSKQVVSLEQPRGITNVDFQFCTLQENIKNIILKKWQYMKP